MKITDYLRDKVIFIVWNLFIAGFTSFLLYMVNADLYFMLFIPCIYLTGSILSLLPEFIMKKKYYNEVQINLKNLDKKCLISEIIEQPDFYEGQFLYSILKTTNKSMNDEIAKYSTSSAEYRAYIEMWVHEIKTPIAGAKLICKNSENKNTLTELEKIDGFVEQALFYSRSNNVEKDYIIKQTNLEELVNGVLRKNSRYLITNKISIQTSDLANTVFTDVKWTDFILKQVIDNSIKYESNRIKLYSAQNTNSISLFICDNGIGIPEQDLRRVFDKGFTGENGRKHGKSTGIGLYLCKKLCKKLGLGIQVKSQRNEGVSVEIVFPKSNMCV